MLKAHNLTFLPLSPYYSYLFYFIITIIIISIFSFHHSSCCFLRDFRFPIPQLSDFKTFHFFESFLFQSNSKPSPFTVEIDDDSLILSSEIERFCGSAVANHLKEAKLVTVHLADEVQ